MKKIFAAVMAFVLAFALMQPCVALGREAKENAAAPPTGSVLEIGAWPQSQVPEGLICGLLEAKLNDPFSPPPFWKGVVLPNGTSVQYTDVYFDAFSNELSAEKTYRVVQIDGAYQWYRWEPLEWEAIEYARDGEVYRAMVCTSVVTSAPNDADAIVAWLQGEFYQTAFKDKERAEIHGFGVPLVDITNGEAALVGDYAALFGAQSNFYFELIPDAPEFMVDPHMCTCTSCCAPDEPGKGAAGSAKGNDSKVLKKAATCVTKTGNGKSALPRSGITVGVRPMLVLKSQAHEKAGGIICCILRWIFGHSH